MTVSTSYTPISVAWTTTNQAIPVTWAFLTGTLVVTYIDGDGVETVKSLTTHYTVSGGTDSNGLPATGTVTMVGAASTGTLRITRNTTKTQASTWSANDPFPQKTIEAALDKLTLLAQEGNDPGTIYDGITGDLMGLVTSGATNYWDAESQIIRNVATPTADNDAATKDYVDGLVGVSQAEAAEAAQAAAEAASATAVAAAEAVEAANLPSDLTGNALKVLQVNAGETGWQFTTAPAGDVTGQASAVDGEIALFSGTSGTDIKRASTTGLLKATSGVLAQAVSGTDYAPATSGSAIQKGNGSGGFSSAVAGTDYVAPATTLTAAGLLTGGGDLSTNRTITLTAASQAEAEAGTDNAKGMTALRTAQAIAALGGASVKAFASFNGTGTPALAAGLNVASITDHGTGDYSVTFTSAIADANYTVSVNVLDASYYPGASTTYLPAASVYSRSTSAVRIKTGLLTLGDPNVTGALDFTNVFVVVLR